MASACTSGDDPDQGEREAHQPPETTQAPPVPLPDDAPALTDVIPAPAEATADSDANFRIDADTEIVVHPDAERVGEYLADTLRPATGFDLPVRAGEPTEGAITLRIDSGIDDDPEAYRLDIARAGIVITATGPAGLFPGVQTLRQLLPADIEQDTATDRDWVVPGGVIIDRPRFSYRGTMLDVARHFFGPDEVKRHIDRIALYKINYLHLHLADDQGWRLEITSWPKLATVGGKTQVGGGEGGYYTQREYTEIVDYAAARGITIVPEIDMPGHTNAALNAYPELNCDGKAPPPYTGTHVGFSSLCIDSEITYRFARDVINEVADLTPGPYLHIGGDEAEQTSDADYRKFFARVLPMISEQGKRALGWHEYAQADLPEDAVVQYWRIETENAPTRSAAAAGHDVLMSPANKTYLDMKYFENDPFGNKWAGPVSVRTIYEWDPATFLAGVGEESVLGVEAPLWTELVETGEDIERMAFPRIPAIAEVGWTAQHARGWEDFAERLAAHAPRMTARGISFHRSPEISW